MDDTIELTARELEQLTTLLSGDHESSSVRSARQNLGRVSKLLVKDDPLNPILHHFSVAAVFPSLQEMYVDTIPPSTISDLYNLRLQLKVLELVNSGITCLTTVLLPIDSKYYEFIPRLVDIKQTIEPIPDRYQWCKLHSLRLVNCGLASLGEVFHFMPCLETLDVSHNDISRIEHLQDCVQLRVLIAKDNRIRSLHTIGSAIGNVVSLDFSENCISSLHGIEQCYSVQYLALQSNRIERIEEIGHLKRLPLLADLFLEGNVIALNVYYRKLVYSQLLQCKTFPMVSLDDLTKLDGKCAEWQDVSSILFLPAETSTVVHKISSGTVAVSINSTLYKGNSCTEGFTDGCYDAIMSRVHQRRKVRVCIIERNRPKVVSSREDPILPSKLRDNIDAYSSSHPLPDMSTFDLSGQNNSLYLTTRTVSVDSTSTRELFNSDFIDEIMLQIEAKTFGTEGGMVSCRRLATVDDLLEDVDDYS